MGEPRTFEEWLDGRFLITGNNRARWYGRKNMQEAYEAGQRDGLARAAEEAEGILGKVRCREVAAAIRALEPK